VLDWYKIITKNHKITIYSFVEPKFSYANACNFGAQKAKGEYLVMLNNDTEVITPNWLELMLGDAQRNKVGTVGARLYFPGNVHLQHAGVGVGLGGYAANLLGLISVSNLDANQKLYADNKRNVAANTAACIMIKSSLFRQLKGFDAGFSVTYNDVDLGLRLLKYGYVNVYNPAVELTHHESISLGLPEHSKRDSVEFEKAKKLLKKRWHKYIAHDPYLNDHYSKEHADFTISE
jgi:GT2 family glycosyltransferase